MTFPAMMVNSLLDLPIAGWLTRERAGAPDAKIRFLWYRNQGIVEYQFGGLAQEKAPDAITIKTADIALIQPKDTILIADDKYTAIARINLENGLTKITLQKRASSNGV